MQNNQISQPIFSCQSNLSYENLTQSLNNVKAPLNYSTNINNQRIPINLNSDKFRQFGKDQQNLAIIYQQNVMLRQQNKELKKQLLLMKRESEMWTADSSRHDQFIYKSQTLDGKQVSKKQIEGLRELREWADTLKKQCEMYEQIISKMDQKITTLNQTCSYLSSDLKKVQLQKENLLKITKVQKNQLIQKYTLKQSENKQSLQQLKNKVNKIMQMYGELQSYSNNCDIEWTMWKQKYSQQKISYINRISELQKLVRGMKDMKDNRTKSPTKQREIQEAYRIGAYSLKNIEQREFSPKRKSQNRNYSIKKHQY